MFYEHLRYYYIIEAVYEGANVNLVYKYKNSEGVDSETTKTVMYGKSVEILTQEILAVSYEDSYIYGWKVDGSEEIILAGSVCPFVNISTTFVETINLTAVYRTAYVFTVKYDTTELSNAGLFSDQKVYIRTTDEDGKVFSEKDLKVKISNIDTDKRKIKLYI